MSKTINLNISMDTELKEQAEAVFSEMGMNITTAFNIFVRQTIRQGKIPFEIYTDPFYSESNTVAIDEAARQIEQGRVVVKTLEDLEAMADTECASRA